MSSAATGPARSPRWRRPFAGLAAGLLVPAGSPAAAPTASFEVAATIVAGCRVGGGSGGPVGTLDYGVRPAISTDTVTAAIAMSGAVALLCTPGTLLTMSVGQGLNQAGGRRLKASRSEASIAYELFADAAFARQIPIGSDVTIAPAGAAPVLLPIYGRLRLPGGLPADRYTDTVIVTLRW